MKRFFFVFSIILVVVMLVVTGAYGALHYGAIWTETKNPIFIGGWNVTEIPFIGSAIVFPAGDLHVVHQAAAADIKTGDVVLFSGGSSWLAKSGYVESVTADKVRLTTTDGATTEEPSTCVKAVYRYRVPRLAWLLNQVKSPVVIGVFTLLLLVTIILWRKLPGRQRAGGGGLSPSDEDIATILY